MALQNIIKNFFGTDDDNEGFVDYDEDEGYDTSSSAVTEREADYGAGYSSAGSSFASFNSSRAINISSGLAGQSKITIMKPQSYEEVMTEGTAKLKAGTIIFLNLNGLSQEVGTRIVDFMTGAAAMCEGRIKKVDTCCFAVAPKNVEWIDTIED